MGQRLRRFGEQIGRLEVGRSGGPENVSGELCALRASSFIHQTIAKDGYRREGEWTESIAGAQLRHSPWDKSGSIDSRIIANY